MTPLEREYRNEIRRALEKNDVQRADALRKWAREHYDFNLDDYLAG